MGQRCAFQPNNSAEAGPTTHTIQGQPEQGTAFRKRHQEANDGGSTPKRNNIKEAIEEQLPSTSASQTAPESANQAEA